MKTIYINVDKKNTKMILFTFRRLCLSLKIHKNSFKNFYLRKGEKRIEKKRKERKKYRNLYKNITSFAFQQ